MGLLAYWDIRGFAEPIRLMLEYSDQSYEEKKYSTGGPPDFKRTMWTDVKEGLDLDFPNLPYYVDGDLKISESWAIMRHVGRHGNLMPDGNHANALCDQAQGVVHDLRMQFVMMCYLPDFPNNKKNFFDNQFPLKAGNLEKYLGKHRYLAGEKLTYVDFALCEILDQMRLMEGEEVGKYPNMCKYLDDFMALERIAAYRNSDRFKKFPCNNKMAKWGGGTTQD